MFDAGAIYSKMLLDYSSFMTGMKAVEKQTSGMKKQWTDLGTSIKSSFTAMTVAAVAASAAMAGVMTKMVMDTTKYGEELYKVSRQTGVSVEDVARLAYAAKQEGISFESVTKALTMLSTSMYNSRGQVNEQSKAFQKMGVSVNNLDGSFKPLNQVLLSMSNYYASAKDKVEALALAKVALGRAGAELIPYLRLGGDEIERLGKRAESLGVVMSARTVIGIKLFAESLTDIQAAIQGIGIAVTTALLPYLITVADALASLDFETVRENVTDLTDRLVAFGAFFAKWGLGIQYVWRVAIYAVMAMLTKLAGFYSGIKVFFLNVLIHVQESLRTLLERVKDFVEKVAPFADKIGLHFVDGFAKNLETGVQKITNSIEKSQQEIQIEKDVMNGLNEETEKAKNNALLTAQNILKVDNAYKKFTASVREHSKALVEAKIAADNAVGEIPVKLNAFQIEMEKAMGIIKKWTDDVDTWGTTLGKMVTKAMDGIADGTAKAFRNAMQNGEDFAEAMRSMFANLMYDIIEMWISSEIKNLFAGLITNTGGGGMLGGLFSAIGGLFTGFQDGTDYVAETGTYRLHEGERVSPKYDSGGDRTQPITIYNLITPEAIAGAMTGKEGENVIVNTINQNSLRNGVVRREVARR